MEQIKWNFSYQNGVDGISNRKIMRNTEVKSEVKTKRILLFRNIWYNIFYRYIFLQAMNQLDMPAEGRAAYGKE